MPVTTFDAGELFTVRIFKQHVNNPDRKWANNYEFRSKIAGDEGDVATLLQTMYNFEADFHSSTIRLIRASASTWQPDSVPYDPNSFLSTPLATLGEQTETGQDLAPLNICLRVNRIPASGRFGQLFYRGVLFENDVEAPAGTAQLSTGGGSLTAFNAATSTEQMDLILGGAHNTWEMVMINSAGTIVRRVAGLLASGISTVPMDHTWFNRSSM